MKRAPKKCETPTAPTYTRKREKREKRDKKKKKADKLFEGIMAENFPNLLENNRFN